MKSVQFRTRIGICVVQHFPWTETQAVALAMPSSTLGIVPWHNHSTITFIIILNQSTRNCYATHISMYSIIKSSKSNSSTCTRWVLRTKISDLKTCYWWLFNKVSVIILLLGLLQLFLGVYVIFLILVDLIHQCNNEEFGCKLSSLF